MDRKVRPAIIIETTGRVFDLHDSFFDFWMLKDGNTFDITNPDHRTIAIAYESGFADALDMLALHRDKVLKNDG